MIINYKGWSSAPNSFNRCYLRFIDYEAAAIGLTPIALSYDFAPSTTLPMLYGVEINVAHVFRAIMGLYLAMVVFWILGATRNFLPCVACWYLWAASPWSLINSPRLWRAFDTPLFFRPGREARRKLTESYTRKLRYPCSIRHTDPSTPE